ncbi:hypothetical protein BDZ89DRAFT_1079139 [Hymenopellis radicata]|nr:hypothetical protein BDZ89DRAFT_1079139 [Hymenopellis radicata]
MIVSPGLAHDHTGGQLPKQSSNGIADQWDAGQALAILESLKRKIKAGQHPAFRPTPQPEALNSLQNGPAYPPSAAHNNNRMDKSRATTKPNPPPFAAAPSTVNERPSFVSSRGPHEPTPVKSSSHIELDKKLPPPHHSDGSEQGADRRREGYPTGDHYIPRDHRPSISNDHHSVLRDTRRPPPEERHYEPTWEREFYARDRRPLHDAPLSDRKPLDYPPVRDTQPIIDDRRPRLEQRQASLPPRDRRALSLERRAIPLSSRPPFEDRRPPPPPPVDDRQPIRDRPMLEERRRSLSPFARRPIFEERRPLPPRSPPPFIKPDQSIQQIPSLSERLKTPPVASTATTSRVESSEFAMPTPPADRRPVFEERRPPPTPPKSAHLPSLRERLKTPPPASMCSRSPPRTRVPSPPPLSARVRPPPNNYRPSPPPEPNSYRPAEMNSYRPPLPESNGYRPPEPSNYRPPDAAHYQRPGQPNIYRPLPPEANGARPIEANGYRPPLPEVDSYQASEASAYSSPTPGANSYRPGERTNYRPREENNYRPGNVYARRERPEYVASGATMELERRRASPPPPPPRSTGGWVDDYRDRGRERDPEYHRPPVSHTDRNPPYPPARKRSASPAPIGYDPKRARYDPKRARYERYLYNRQRSPVGGRP